MSTRHPFTVQHLLRNGEGPHLVPFLKRHAPSLQPPDPVTLDTLQAAFAALPEPERRLIELHGEAVHKMATTEGINLAVEEATALRVDIVSGLNEQNGLYDQALWLSLEHSQVFNQAALYLNIDGLPGRSWHRTFCPAGLEPVLDEVALTRLEHGLASYFKEHEARGATAHVECYRRGPDFGFLVYLEDHPHTEPLFEGGKLVKHLQHPAFQVVFVYNPAGTLNVFCHGGFKKGMLLRELFGDLVLGLRLPAERRASPAYDLGRACQQGRDFVIPAGSSVVAIDPIAVSREKTVGTRNTVMVERGDYATLAEACAPQWPMTPEEALATGKVPISATRVLGVKLLVTYRRPNGREGTKTVWLSRTSCRLGHEGIDAEVRAILRGSGVELSAVEEAA